MHVLIGCAIRFRSLPFCLIAMAALLFAGVRADETPLRPKQANGPLPLAEVDADPKIPTLAQTVGHSWGGEISSHAELERYGRALAEAAPDRCQRIKYGKTYQNKDLFYLVISSAANLKRIDAIRERNLALADPRVTSPLQAAQIATDEPAIVWLANCVHGNEASPSDAAVLTAYHLLADRRPQTLAWLDKLVVIIDPLQNPDGRDRFVHFHRETRGGFDQEHPLAADRLERWPTGRFNHYLFDMNRDWYLQSQQESAARVAAFLHWKPQIFVDAHEMGPESNFYFDPATDPYNGHTLARQKDWHVKIGKHHAAAFDRQGISYTNREMFDSFGPQYGSTWPILHGSIGILWEQAGARGRVVSREDKTKLFYRDGVRHHYISGLATLDAASQNREALLLDFYRSAADSVKLGDTGSIRAFVLLEGKRPARAAALAQMLIRNCIEVRRTLSEWKGNGIDTVGDVAGAHVAPAGSYLISLNQPAARMALTLLERHQDMGAEFIKRQEERVKRGLPDEIYDSTSWSLPLAFGVPCLALEKAPSNASEPIATASPLGKVIGERAKLAYMVDGQDDAMLAALCRWHAQGLRVAVFSEATRVAGHSFPRGSLLLRVADNPESLHEAMANAAKTFGVTIHAIDTGFVDEGASLGGPNVHWVRPPRVLLVTDRPAGNEVGHTWFLFDQVWKYPVTRIAGRALGEVDWGAFDVCILPHGNYKTDAPSEDVVRRLKDWVQDGGTLILVGGAAGWATDAKVKLLASSLETRPADGGDKKGKKAEKKPPLAVPGVFVRATVDDDHFVTWGFGKEAILHFSGDRIFTPLKLSDGKNLVTFTAAGEANCLASGYCWPQTLKMLPGKPYVMVQPQGRGHIVAFADDPNFRAFSPHLQRLFYNAVFYSLPAKREIPTR